MVGGEGSHPPVKIWCHTSLFPRVVSDGGRGWGAGRSYRPYRHCLWHLSLAVLHLRSQITTVRWSYCEAISFPKQGSKPNSREAAVWTKHTSLENIKSSCAAEQSTSGKHKGLNPGTQCS
jgi:hypothetical protein